MKNACYILLFLIVSLNVKAQTPDSTDFSRLPDKVYMHLDKNLYTTGDTIWAKAYAFHRNNLNLSDNSYSLHIQLLSQDGAEMGTYKMLMVKGMGYGQIPLSNKVKPGFYQIIAHTGHMKNFSRKFFYKSTIEVRAKTAQMTIKSYFDKDEYRIGDTAKLTFRVYDEFQMLVPKHRFHYDLVYQEKSLERGSLKCNEQGTVTAFFPIEKGTKSNPPCLNLSYYDTHNYEDAIEQQVYIPMVREVLHIDFFPEGGDLIKGIPSKVAFKGVDALGEAVAIEGILEEDGRPIMNVNTLYEGMGFFTIMPSEASYTFRVTKPQGIDSVYTLPEAIMTGYHLMFVKQDESSVYLRVDHNYGVPQNVKVWISQYDNFLDLYNLEVEGSRYFAIPKDALPQGLVTFTLTDDKDVPMSERLVFIPDEENGIKVSTPQDIYSQRKKVEVSLALDNPKAKAHLSVAVVDSVLGSSPYVEADNIKSYALLRSELRGDIKNINSYLGSDRASQGRCDLLVMTHGWRRYSWIRNQEQLDSVTMLDFNVVSGTVMRFRKPEVKAQMTVFAVGDFTNYIDFETNEKGQFKITPSYEDRASQKILLMAKSAKGKGNVNISVFNTDTIFFGQIAAENKDNIKPLVYAYDYYVDEEDEEEDVSPFFSYESKMLQELVVYGERQDLKTEEGAIPEAVAAFAAGSLSGEDLVEGYSFGDFVEQASHRAVYDRSIGRVTVRNRGESGSSDAMSSFDTEIGAEIYVNDMPWGKDVGSLDFLTKDDIAEIVVLDPDGASQLYGAEGDYGVILVSTYSDDFNAKEQVMNRNMAIFGRFIDSKEYYKQAYETKEQDSLVVVDNRITLHWEPFVETDENGMASFDFYTDDISGTKQIIVQGIDDDGHLYYQTKDFEVQVVGL